MVKWHAYPCMSLVWQLRLVLFLKINDQWCLDDYSADKWMTRLGWLKTCFCAYDFISAENYESIFWELWATLFGNRILAFWRTLCAYPSRPCPLYQPCLLCLHGSYLTIAGSCKRSFIKRKTLWFTCMCILSVQYLCVLCVSSVCVIPFKFCGL